MKKRIKVKNVIIAIIIVIILIFNILLGIFMFNMRKMDSKNTIKEVIVENGMSVDSILNLLIEEDLIRNKFFSKVYIKLSNFNMQAGTYDLNTSMSTMDIIKNIASGKVTTKDNVSITFQEGLNARKIARIIESNTNNSYDDVIKVLEDRAFAQEMIDKYWFLDSKILNESIYYPLEGYLFPNTYRFTNKDVSVKDIFIKMLNETDRQLSKYRDKINKSDLSIHELMTLASIVELEGASANDRRGVAGVFYNRLNSTSYPTLGSDATTYYASKIDDWTVSLTYKELNDCTNKYNTRCSSNTGLPVGPICNPSIESIDATLNPEDNNYYYFVADCEGEVYLTKTSAEHNNIINKLKRENNWCA